LITTTQKKSELELGSNAVEYYSNYWSEGIAVSSRTHLLADWIISTFLNNVSGKEILEVGVGGEGGIISRLADANNVFGADVSESAIRNCQRMGLRVKLCDLNRENLPYQDGSFDCVVALEVFEHFSNPQMALEEIRRVLRDGGLLLISIPTRWSYHWPRCFYPDMIFGQDAFLRFLRANGFRIDRNEHGVVPCNAARRVPEFYKYQNLFFSGLKLSDADADSYFDNAMYFWDEIDENGMRFDPITALDLFRKSYKLSGSNKHLMAFTHALLYRVLNCELDEFREMFQEIKRRDAVVSEQELDSWREAFAGLLLEADMMGLPLVDAREMEKVLTYAKKKPELMEFCKRLHIVL